MMLAPSKRSVRRSSAIGNRLIAHYEYSPFGMQTKATGSYASSNPFRFSSEYYDTETGLVYYNYRYYDAKLGRWLSRDYIGEFGGTNLFAIIKNNAVNQRDILGMKYDGCCGRDITEKLNKLILKVQNEFKKKI